MRVRIKHMSSSSTSQIATILEIQRMSTEDGPGLRTTVFFKGCSLRCSWCHNPESISRDPQTQWVGSRCIGCKTCIETCQNGALTFDEKGLHIERTLCRSCGECVEECPSTALELLGTEWNLEDLVREVVKDKAYFDTSGGGVTISGGEPGLQAEFAAEFLQRMKERGIQTAFDTCGLVSRKALERILPYSTIVLFDIKEIDPDRHLEMTGGRIDKILENLLYIRDFINSHVHPKTLWIRTPIIPGATDREENIRGIGRFLAENLGKALHRWELCAFNNLCRDKYFRLGLPWRFGESDLVRESKMEKLTAVAGKSGVNPDIIHWSGSTRLQEHQRQENEKNIV